MSLSITIRVSIVFHQADGIGYRGRSI